METHFLFIMSIAVLFLVSFFLAYLVEYMNGEHSLTSQRGTV